MADNSHIIVLPDDLTLLTEANRQMLRHPDFLTPHAPNAKMTFPIIELDEPALFAQNRQAVRRACQEHHNDAPILIGAPGLEELHLPEEYAPLSRLAAKAATIAQAVGALGQDCIAFTPRFQRRPTYAPHWHIDSGLVLLICSSDAGTVLSLPNAEANQTHTGYQLNKLTQYSAMPGMPLCFAGVQHTYPYNADPSIKREKSGVVLFFNFKAGHSEVDLRLTSAAVKRAYQKAGGPIY